MNGPKAGTRDFLESKGVLAYATVPREVILRAMEPDQCLDSRLRHAMILWSWCGPEPSEAVVRKKADGFIVRDGQGNPVPAQLKDLLALIGMPPGMKGHLSRTAQALVGQNLLRFDGRTMYLVFKPLSGQSSKNSHSVASTGNWNIAGLVVRTGNLPVDPVARTRILQLLEVASTRWKADLRDAKTRNRELLVRELSEAGYAIGVKSSKSLKSLKAKPDDERPSSIHEVAVAPEVRPSVSPPEIALRLREDARRWLTTRFLFPTPPDNTVMDALMEHISTPAILSRFQQQIEKQKPRPDSWKYFVPVAQACAEAESQTAEERRPPTSEGGLCPDCQGTGLVRRVIRGQGSTERCACQWETATSNG